MITVTESMRKYHGDDLIVIKYNYEPGRIARLFFRPETWTSRYVGECTVWHHFPSGERCDTTTESLLADVWDRLKRQNARKKQRHLSRLEQDQSN